MKIKSILSTLLLTALVGCGAGDSVNVNTHGDKIADHERRIALLEALGKLQDEVLGLHDARITALEKRAASADGEIEGLQSDLDKAISDALKADGALGDRIDGLTEIVQKDGEALKKLKKRLFQRCEEREIHLAFDQERCVEGVIVKLKRFKARQLFVNHKLKSRINKLFKRLNKDGGIIDRLETVETKSTDNATEITTTITDAISDLRSELGTCDVYQSNGCVSRIDELSGSLSGLFRDIERGELDGKDGTSCTVSRDEEDGFATITCGTISAVVNDGLVGPIGKRGPRGWKGKRGKRGTSCSVTKVDDVATITCGDDEVFISDGIDGVDGDSCSVTKVNDVATIICDEEEGSVTITDGTDGTSTNGTSCSVAKVDGVATITCGNDEVKITDGTNGTNSSGGATLNYINGFESDDCESIGLGLSAERLNNNKFALYESNNCTGTAVREIKKNEPVVWYKNRMFYHRWAKSLGIVTFTSTPN